VVAALLGSAVVLVGAYPVQADVDLADFGVTGRDEDVLIEWATMSELTTYGFNLYRSQQGGSRPSSPLNDEVIPAENLGGVGLTRYTYVDGAVEIGVTYYYWLEVLDFSPAGTEVFGPESATPGPPPTSTPTATPTELATATPTWTPTVEPTAASTPEPTATPSPTATTVPTFTPTVLPTETFVPGSTPEPSPTSDVHQPPSPTATAESLAPPTATVSDPPEPSTPTLTATSAAVGPESSTDGTGAADDGSQTGSSGSTSWSLRWPTIHPTTVLLSLALISFMGVLLLSVALVLVRRYGL
jgi:hypothetical protein